MLRTGAEYRESIRDGREVWMNGERVNDVTTHPAFKPLVDVRARIYDMAHEARYARRHDLRRSEPASTVRSRSNCRSTREDWQDKRVAVDAVFDDIGGVVTRVGDETIGEMWSLYDGQDVLNEVDPRFAKTSATTSCRRCTPIRSMSRPTPIRRATARSGRRIRTRTCCSMWSRRPIAVSSCAAPNTKPPRPTPIRPSSSRRSPTGATTSCPIMRSGSSPQMGAPGMKHICRTGFAGRGRSRIIRSSNRFDEVDTLIDLRRCRDPVGRRAVLPPHPGGDAISARRCTATARFPTRSGCSSIADMLIGAALFNARQTGFEKQQAVQEKLAQLACFREGINAHLTAAIATARAQPRRVADAEPVAALHRPGAGLLRSSRR